MKFTKYFSLILICSFISISCSKGKKEFEKVKSIGTIEAYEEFVNENPNSKYITNAKENMASLIFDGVQKENTIAAYEQFISEHPKSKCALLAETILDTLRYNQLMSPL